MAADLAALTGRIEPRVWPSPLAGHEHVRGWGVIACPFESGHVLALRVFPQNDFCPFVSLWHRTPGGAWSIYVDGPRLDTACPRYFGEAAERSAYADIGLRWADPNTLRVEMTEPSMEWTLRVDPGPLVRAVNAAMGALPEWLQRRRAVTSLLERVGDRLFGFGDMTLAATVPNGQFATMLPRRLYPIVETSATLAGEWLGPPVTGGSGEPENPRFGELRLPARPVLAVGGAYLTIEDPAEHERLVAAAASGGGEEPVRPVG